MENIDRLRIKNARQEMENAISDLEKHTDMLLELCSKIDNDEVINSLADRKIIGKFVSRICSALILIEDSVHEYSRDILCNLTEDDK